LRAFGAVLQVDDSRNFGPSLRKCPSLKMFNSYKVRSLPRQQSAT
jgi:hypothetical protein